MITLAIVLVSVMAATQSAFAKPTACSEVVSAFDQEDRVAAQKFDDEIRNAMEAIDEEYVGKGQRSVIAPLSTEGFVKIRMIAVENCRAHPNQTLIRSARVMYDGVRSMQDAVLGK